MATDGTRHCGKCHDRTEHIPYRSEVRPWQPAFQCTVCHAVSWVPFDMAQDYDHIDYRLVRRRQS